MVGADAVPKKLGSSNLVVTGTFRRYHDPAVTAWGTGLTVIIPDTATAINIIINYNNSDGLAYKLDDGSFVTFSSSTRLEGSIFSGASSLWVGLTAPIYQQQSQQRAEVTIEIKL